MEVYILEKACSPSESEKKGQVAGAQKSRQKRLRSRQCSDEETMMGA